MKIDSWYASKVLPTIKQWREQEQSLKDAVALMPANASMFNSMGRLYEFRAFRMESSTIGRDLYALKAIMQFRLARDASPAWVYPWMNMALIKARIGQIDVEYKHAYMSAIQSGPWERNVMPVLIELGLHAYALMGEQKQLQTLNYIDKVIAGEGGAIRSMLSSRGTIDAVCEQLLKLQRSESFNKICDKQE